MNLGLIITFMVVLAGLVFMLYALIRPFTHIHHDHRDVSIHRTLTDAVAAPRVSRGLVARTIMTGRMLSRCPGWRRALGRFR